MNRSPSNLAGDAYPTNEGLIRVTVHLAERTYSILLPGTDPNFSETPGVLARLRNKGALAFIVCDEGAKAHIPGIETAFAEQGYQVKLWILPAGEAQKALSVAEILYEALLDLKADRKTLLVALGGGVVGDLTGFVAATYLRGLDFFMVPTTLLSMVDSSVGGKTGVNLTRGKNLIGCFHQPIGVWIDPTFLTTLPDRDFRSGLAEVVKYGMIMDAEFWDRLEKEADLLLARDPFILRRVIARCCQLKARVVSEDEHELTGLRAILNYGHTFGHAFETIAGYGKWLHGEAVAAGMHCAMRLAVKRGLMDQQALNRQEALLKKFGLPTEPDSSWSSEELIDLMRADKKAAAGKLRFILPTRIGHVQFVEGIEDAEVRTALGR